MRPHTPLPIDAVTGDLTRCLQQETRAVLVAPPGAGKTTRVPLALLDEPCAALEEPAGRALMQALCARAALVELRVR